MMMKTQMAVALLGALAALAAPVPARAQRPPVGTIDVYGLRKISAAQVREALGINVGDSLSAMAMLTAPGRLADLPGVSSAALDPVCCEGGKTMLYVGIAEDGAPALELRPPPVGASRLSADIVAAGEAFADAYMRAVMRGVVGEDVSEGHSLMADSAARAVQRRFVELAARDLDSLRAVLRTASDADHRALAAAVIAYAADKKAVVPDLVYAMRDPSREVRNNATRALALIALLGQRRPELGIRVPYEPFIDLLNSIAWTDRNKASLALMQLSEGRDPALLAALKARAFDALVDIAHWTNPGHSLAGVFMLGRIAGIADAEILTMFERGDTQQVIDAARKGA